MFQYQREQDPKTVFLPHDTESSNSQRLGSSGSTIDEEEDNDIDPITSSIGNIGRWQLQVYIIMNIIIIPGPWLFLGVVLYSHETKFWCKSENSSYSELNESLVLELSSNSTCDLENPCSNGYQYDTSFIGTTIISEWDIVCDKEYLISATQSIIVAGASLGSFIIGIFADKYGRRPILLCCTIMRSLCGIVSGLAPNYIFFGISRFLIAFFEAGATNQSVSMFLEVLGGVWRPILAILGGLSFTIGCSIIAGIAYLLRNWRYTQIVLYLLSTICVLCAWIVPESPRWLLAVGRKSKALQILKFAAAKNKIQDVRITEIVMNYRSDTKFSSDNYFFWLNLVKTPKLRITTILISTFGVGSSLVTYGSYQYFGQFGSNPFKDVAMQGVMLSFGVLAAAVLITRDSGQRTLALTSFVIGILMCLILLLPAPNEVSTYLVYSSYFCTGILNAVAILFVGNSYPTIIRSTGIGFYYTTFSVGAMIAPFIVDLRNVYWHCPLSVFAFLAFLQGVSVFIVPKINYKNLPDTIEDIEN